MPRQARLRGAYSIYHVIQRGNEKKPIYLSDEDRNRFIDTLIRMKEKYEFEIYCYCLMDNHFHIVIYDDGKDISQIMKSINISYALYFNRKYKRTGHLFQDRFRSEIILDDPYLVEVSKYIHNNPVKAKMVKNPESYKWSSYGMYIGKRKDTECMVSFDRVLKYFSKNKERAKKEYIKYVNKDDDDNSNKIMGLESFAEDYGNNTRPSINSIKQAIEYLMYKEQINKANFGEFIKDKHKRNEMIKEIRKNSTLTLKEIGDMFGGLSESSVSKILIK